MRWFRRCLYWIADCFYLLGEFFFDIASARFEEKRANAWYYRSSSYNRQAISEINGELSGMGRGQCWILLFEKLRNIEEAQRSVDKEIIEPKTA